MKELSPREKQVLALTREGYTSAKMGAKLGLRGLTVRSYRKTLKQKLDASREDAAKRMRDFEKETSWQNAVEAAEYYLEQREMFPEPIESPDPLLPGKAVVSPPGLDIWKLAEFLCTKKTYDSIFVPLLADFHHEYFDALSVGREWKARWLRVLYCGAFFKSAGLNVAMRLLREAWDRFKKVTP